MGLQRIQRNSAEHRRLIELSNKRFSAAQGLTGRQAHFVELIKSALHTAYYDRNGLAPSQRTEALDAQLAEIIESGTSPDFDFLLPNDEFFLFRPLPAAVQCGFPRLTKACLEAGALLSECNERKVTEGTSKLLFVPLLAKTSNKAVLEVLIDYGADPLEKIWTDSGLPEGVPSSILDWHISNRIKKDHSLEGFTYLLKETVSAGSRRASSEKGWQKEFDRILARSLGASLSEGNGAVSRLLIDSGADCLSEYRQVVNTFVPLYFAIISLKDAESTLGFELCRKQHSHVIEYRFDSGMTPLMVAAFNTNDYAIRYLLSCGADKAARDNKGRTAYDYSLYKPTDGELILANMKNVELESLSPKTQQLLKP